MVPHQMPSQALLSPPKAPHSAPSAQNLSPRVGGTEVGNEGLSLRKKEKEKLSTIKSV